MEGHSTPVEAQLRTEGRDGQHQQQCQEVNGIDFRQAIPDKPLVAGHGDAIPEHVRVVVGQDESAEEEEERYGDFGRTEKYSAVAHRVHARSRQYDVIQIKEDSLVKLESCQ